MSFKYQSSSSLLAKGAKKTGEETNAGDTHMPTKQLCQHPTQFKMGRHLIEGVLLIQEL